ncbi:MAG TPA: DUF58 domain-containing protein [Anaerolineae bacterium]|nr:DUF58 domain-containing protein [Anaerolineae bacterium]
MPRTFTRSLLLNGLVYGLVLVGLASLNGGLLALVIPFVIYLAAGLMGAPEKLQLTATHAVSDERAAQGAPIVVKLSVTNAGAHLAEVLIEDVLSRPLDVIGGESRLMTQLAPGATVELRYILRAARGAYRFQGIRVTAYDHFGLFQRQTTLPVSNRLIVMPQIAKLRRVAIRPRQTRAYAGPIPARRGGPGVEFFGVRGYQPGDSQRWINWKASARHPGALFTTEFEQERVADVGLILDARRRTHTPALGDSLFELMAQAAAALAEPILNEGNRVGLLIYGSFLDWTIPGYGKVQRERILQALAKAEPGDSQVFDKLDLLPTRLFPPESQLILISPLVKDDLPVLTRLRARGYQLLVVSPDPTPLEAEALGRRPGIELAARIARMERSLLLHQLRHAGIRIVDWQIDAPLDHIVHASLGRTPVWFRGERVESRQW